MNAEDSVGTSASAFTKEGTSSSSLDTDIDSNILLVDETSSDDSDDEEIAVFDSRDLSLLSNERKALCEDRLYYLYKTFRYNGKEYKTKRNIYGFTTLDTDFIDYIQKGTTLDFDEERISQAVIIFHVDELGINEGASVMRLEPFDFIILLMDHIWKERDKTIENYSISRVAGYIGLDRAHMRLLGNLVNSNVALSPSEIASKTLCEPLELVVMLTMLLAQMYGWPVADDFNKKWKQIETAPVPSDEEAVETVADFVTIAQEVLEDFKNDRSSPLCRLLPVSNNDNLVTWSTDLAQYTTNLLTELHKLPVPEKTIPQADILPPDWACRAETLANERNKIGVKKSATDYQKNDPSQSGEEISVVSVTRSELSHRDYVLIDDPVDISEIPNGSFCLARQQKSLNFIRCQIIQKVSPREYSVQFNDGKEEVVDIGRIARKVDGRLRMWEGVRVCALYEPKIRNDRYRKAFYSGIVGIGPYGFSQGEMLVFFDNGIDSFVAERTVLMLADQKYKVVNSKDVIDRRSNWILMPPSRQKFVKHYLKNFPDWPLVPMKRKENTQRVNILRDGKPHSAYVLRTERQFALLRFPNRGKPSADCVSLPCNRHNHQDEWVYRGSERLDTVRQNIDRLEKIEHQEKTGVTVPVNRSRREARLARNLEYAVPMPRRNISDIELVNLNGERDLCPRGQALLGDNEPNLPRRQTARKGGSSGMQRENVYRAYSEGRELRARKEKNLTVHKIPEWNELRQDVHSQCTIDCLQRLDKDPYDKEFFGYSPYMIPLLVGWCREIATFSRRTKIADRRKAAGSSVVYRTPCGIYIYRMAYIAKYLKDTCSRLTIDLFTFDRSIRPNVIYHSPAAAKVMDDFTNGYEAIPIAVYNEVDDEKPPVFEYDRRRYPYDATTDVSSISFDFCCGCSCTDDCSDATRCECRILTRTEILRLDRSLQPTFSGGYMYRSLALGCADEWYLSGLYECNEKCGCSRSTCHNRVAQQPMKIPMELFKTKKMGWGIRSMVDVPAGVFLCTYAGAILSDTQAEKQGKLHGDEYFADINLVDNVEKEKRNAGIDLGDPNNGYYTDEDIHEPSTLSDSESGRGNDETYEDEAYDSGQDSSFSSEGSRPERGAITTRNRQRREQKQIGTANEETQDAVEMVGLEKEQASDLDYARSSLLVLESDVFTNEIKQSENNAGASEASTETGPPKGRFNMQKYIENMGLPSLYIIDAKKKGNIGRFFNHCCEPNIRTQLVYVDTHDFRLPWITFFTTTRISAGSELFWDYGYLEGAVIGKQLECFCESRFCRKRLL